MLLVSPFLLLTFRFFARQQWLREVVSKFAETKLISCNILRDILGGLCLSDGLSGLSGGITGVKRHQRLSLPDRLRLTS